MQACEKLLDLLLPGCT